jgi:hypothetical protein
MKRRKAQAPNAAETAIRGPVVKRLEQMFDDTATQNNRQQFQIITVAPCGRIGWYSARLLSGEVIVASSRQPFFDAARRLIECSFDPSSILEMWHSGANSFALRAKLGDAARLTVEEAAHGPTFRSFRTTLPSAVAGPLVRQTGPTAPTPGPPDVRKI